MNYPREGTVKALPGFLCFFLMEQMQFKKTDTFFVLFIVFVSAVLWFLPTGFEKPELMENTYHEQARVVSVDNSDLKRVGLVLAGEQHLILDIESGSFKGERIDGINPLMGQMSYDKLFLEGDRVLAILKTDGDNKRLISARAAELYRLDVELVLFALFGIFLVLFARWTGFRALLSFVFTALVIWKVLIPLFLKGIPPLPVAFLIVSLTTSVIMLLITGFTRKGAVALAGAISGVAITAVLAVLFGALFRVPGTARDFAEMLSYSGFYTLSLTDIFLSGIFISAAGAVMDMAMDVAASQAEVIEKHPEITRKELIMSGFRVGQAVVGTMTTTLLFAYSGSFTFALMFFMAQGSPMGYMFTMNYVAAEILLTLVGSFGLVLVAPATALLGGYMFTTKKNPLRKPAQGYAATGED